MWSNPSLLLLLLLLLGAMAVIHATTALTKPNIVMILVDDLGHGGIMDNNPLVKGLVYLTF